MTTHPAKPSGGPGGRPPGGVTDLFDPACGYRLSPNVSVRPEPFGALLYDFHTRRLSFLKTPALVRVVRELERHDDVGGALDAAGVPDPERARYVEALEGLAATGTIVRGEQ